MKAGLWASMLALSLSLLSGCGMTRQIAESSLSYYSFEHFTLVATVPANFGFTSRARYYPKAGESCKMYSPGLGAMVTREQQRSDSTPAKDTAQTLSTKIPLEFHIADCSMELASVGYEVNGTYGPDAWDHGLDMAGGISVVGSSSTTVVSPVPELIEQRGVCSWRFQISTAKSKRDQIEKLLNCSAADPDWKTSEKKFQRKKTGTALSRNSIKNKTVHVIYKFSTDEKPAYINYWVKVADGWKPCTGNWNTNREERCTAPPKFRTFKQDGRECRVYPTCTEQGVNNE